jgi:PAS domain S-box-containing protein
MRTRTRLLRILVPLVFATAFALFLAFARYNNAVVDRDIENSQRTDIGVLAQIGEDQLQQLTRGVRQIAGDISLREFARETLVSVSGTTLNDAQQSVLLTFANLINQNVCQYFAVRYITYTGTTWSEVNNFGCDAPTIDPSVRFGGIQSSGETRLALNLPLSAVVVSDPELRRTGPTVPLSQQRPFVRISSPVATQGDDDNIAGIVQVEASLDALLAAVESEADSIADRTPDRRVLVVDGQNRLLFDSGDPDFSYVRNLAFSTPVTLDDVLPDAAALLLETAAERDSGVVNVGVERDDFAISTANLVIEEGRTPYLRVLVVDQYSAIALADVREVVLAFILTMAAAGLISLVIVRLLNDTLRPIEAITQSAGIALAATPIAFPRTVSESRAVPRSLITDERPKEPTPIAPDMIIGAAAPGDLATLISGFNTLQQRVFTLQSELDRELGRYARNLDIAARIGRETATLYDTDQLLNRAIDLICREYGFYHAQVFLIDDIGRNAVLVYSYSDAGREMLRRNHKLPVGSQSIVGQVTALQRPVIVNDTREPDTLWKFNPLLPDTLAEMALPLQAGDRVIGALDIQSRQPNVFRDEDLSTFQLLADQIAIALQNARLLVESRERVEQIDQLNRQLTRSAWDETSARDRAQDAYRYDLMTVRSDRADAPLDEAVSPTSIRIPISVGGEVIGAIDAETEGDQEFTPGDESIMRAVAERVSLAVERARLFEETQINLAETSTLYQLSRYLNEAANLDEIIQALIISVMPDAVGGQIAVFDEYMPMVGPNWTEIIAEWTINEEGMPVEGHLKGTQFQLRSIQQLHRMNADRAEIVPDIDQAEPALAELLAGTRTKALVIIPFSVRGNYRGIVFVNFPATRPFSEREKRLYAALIDQAGVAIDNRMLIEQNDIALTRIERLYSSSRQINISQSAYDLVQAAVNSTEDRSYDYLLAMVEGGAAAGEWPSAVRVVAYSKGNAVMSDTTVFPLEVDAESPLRMREPVVATDTTGTSSLGTLLAHYGHHFGAAFPLYSANQPLALFIIASESARDMNEDEFEVYRALTGQMSTVLQNRRLLDQSEQDRARLSSIIGTLPAGVLVLDAGTLYPVEFNEQMQALIGQPLSRSVPFSASVYGLMQVSTRESYEDARLPIARVLETGDVQFADDVALFRPDGREIDLLVTAAPIRDGQGAITAVVAAFQDITALRGLESTLQRNLKDTIALYETTRALVEAEGADDVLDELVEQLGTPGTLDVQVALLDEEQGGTIVVRSLSGYTGPYTLPDDLLDSEDARMAGSLASDRVLGPEARAALAALDVRAYVSVPLRSRAGVYAPLGWIVILYDREQNFSQERQQFLTTLTDSAAVALDNRNLFQSTEQALQETAAMYGATTSISRVRNLDTLASTLRNALDTLRPDVFAAYLQVNPRADTLTELFNVNLDGAPVDFPCLIADHDLFALGTLVIDNLRAVADPTPLIDDLLATRTLNALSMIPLRAKDETRGLVFVGYHDAHRGTSGESRYLSALGESASVVADNIILFDEIQTTLQETDTLYRTSRRLSDATESQDILTSIVDNLGGRVLSLAFMAQLTFSTPDWASTEARADITASWSPGENGVDLRGVVISRSEFPAWPLLATPTIRFIDDVEHEPGLADDERANLLSLDMRAVAILPLRFSGRPGGAIMVGAPAPYAHTERDLRIFTSLSEQASLRLEASRLLEQTERRARQLATSAQVSQIASGILELEKLLPRLVDIIRDSFRYDHVQIFLMDREDDYAYLRASTGDAGRKLLQIGHRLQRGSQSVIGQVTATARPTLASDTADARVVHRPNPYLPNTRSEMAIPLILDGQVVGALDVQSNTPNAFDSDDVATLTTLSAQISVALRNAQLYEQSRDQASEMSFLFSVTTAAASAASAAEALESVAHELAETFGALSVSIYLPGQVVDTEGHVFRMLRPAALTGRAGSAQPLSELADISLDDDRNLISVVANSRRPRILSDAAAEPDYFAAISDARSAVIVPLTASDQLVGLIAVESDQPSAFDDSTLTLLLTLSGTLSAIVQNQNLLETLQKTNEQLRELDRLKSDFLANMSHELRTPLNSIIGFSRVILKGIDGPLTEMQEQDLSTIYNSGLHLLNLINDILDQAKIAAGKMDLQADYFEIRSVVEGVRSIGIGLIKDKPIDMRMNIAPGLPRAFGDEFRTRQVLLNLVSNASKFTREGTITIDVYTIAHQPPHLEEPHVFVRVDVTDTGIGIAEKDIPSLFEAFRQVDSSLTRTVGGTGLGLPIAKSLTEMQGGAMLVESAVNVGSTFSILIPTEPGIAPEKARKDDGDTKTNLTPTRRNTGMLNPAAAEGAGQPAARQAAPNGSDGHGENGAAAKDDTNSFSRPRKTTEINLMRPPMPVKRQLLLIEDNPDMVDQLRRALGREGFDIFTASIPLEAEAMASGLHPTVIVMDVNFSNGAGWDILARLKAREDTVDIPIVVVSLSAESDRALESGVFRFVRRPFTPEGIVEAVHAAEQESRTRRILIIDDQPESTRLLTQILEASGSYRVFAAHSGMEGISLVARRRPDLILLDLRMPEMDGFRVIEELRGNPETSNIPIVVVTAEALTAEEQARLSAHRVIYKTELSAEKHRPLIDGVQDHLEPGVGD